MTEGPPPIGSSAWIEAELRARLGPRAALGEIVFEGKLLHARALRVPVGDAAVLDLEVVTVELGAGPVLAPLPLAARLVAVRGAVAWGGRSLALSFAVAPEESASLIAGVLGVGDLQVDVGLAVAFTREGLRLDRLHAARGDARLTGSGFVGKSSLAPLLTLHGAGVDADLLHAIAAVLGAELRLPAKLRATVDLLVNADRTASLAIDARTDRSELAGRFQATPEGALLGSTLRGQLAAPDARALGLFNDALHAGEDDVLDIDGRLGGTLRRPSITGRVSSRRLEITGRDRPSLTLQDVSVILDIGPDGLAGQSFVASLGGGAVNASGQLRRATGELEVRVACTGVRIERLPAGVAPERDLSEFVTGAVSGSVLLARVSKTSPLRARGEVQLDDGSLPALEKIAPRLARMGLPPLVTRARGPARARFALDGDDLDITALEAAIPSGRVRGAVRVRGSGTARRFEVDADVLIASAYLARSTLFALPAAMTEELLIPLHVEGALGALHVRTDASRIVDSVLSAKGFGARLRALFGGRASRRR